jgi:uncharacterized protein involved in exopolysaccharide biosynthesis
VLNEFAQMPAQSPQDRERSGPDMHDLFVRGVVRSLPWLCLFVALGVATGFVIGLIQPNTFVSTTKLMLRPGAREQITSESLVGLESEHLSSPLTMYDELQMLSDPAIFESVARQIGPNEILEPADPERDDGPRVSAPVHWVHYLQARCNSWLAARRDPAPEGDAERLRRAAKALREDTSILNEAGSNVIVITHTSTSPERARKVAQTLADAFIERHREQFSIQSLVEASRVKLEQAKQLRDAAANAYLEQVNKSGFAELDQQVPALTTEITALENELLQARIRQRGIAKQRAALSGRLEDVPAADIEILAPAVMIPNEEYETQLMLKRSLLTQKANIPLENRTIEERRRLEQYYDQQIAAADQKLQQLPKAVAQNAELREHENAAHTTLSTRIEDLELEDQALVEKVELLDQRLTEKRALVADLRKQVLTATLRQKDLETAREAEDARYKQLLSRFSIFEALGNIDLHEQPNLRVLQAATLELDKVGPKRLTLLLKGLCAGLLVGLAFAVLRQRLDRRLSQPETFERTHGLPVLGVVPDVPALHRLPRTVTKWS